MPRLAKRITIVLWIVVGLVYISSKVDFFRRFDPENLSAYIAGHWPYWVAMVVLTGLLLLVVRHRPDAHRAGVADGQE